MSKKEFSFQFATFNDLVSALELIFSPSAASVILFTTAVRCGAQSHSRLKKNFRTKEGALRRLSELKKKENWGKLAFQDIDFENGSGKVIVSNGFEVMAYKTREGPIIGTPHCNFLKGFLAGFLSELFEKTVTVAEAKCAGKGDDKCEFTFE